MIWLMLSLSKFSFPCRPLILHTEMKSRLHVLVFALFLVVVIAQQMNHKNSRPWHPRPYRRAVIRGDSKKSAPNYNDKRYPLFSCSSEPRLFPERY